MQSTKPPKEQSDTASSSAALRKDFLKLLPLRHHTIARAALGETRAQNTFSMRSYPVLFGMPLEEVTDLPPFLVTLINALHSQLHTEGIFRVSPSFEDVKQLRAAAEQGEENELVSAPPHVQAGLLTMFLLELPEPLIPFALYHDALAATTSTSRLAALILRLSRTASALLKMLVQLWQATERHSMVNKMTDGNLGVVFGPLILRPHEDTLDMQRILQQNAFVATLIRAPIDEIFR